MLDLFRVQVDLWRLGYVWGTPRIGEEEEEEAFRERCAVAKRATCSRGSTAIGRRLVTLAEDVRG